MPVSSRKEAALTSGTLLDGRLRYDQPAEGYRTGLEPVLLAASVPARPGERVLEAGCGAGAGLLCLAARVPNLSGTGVELEPAMAALAAANFAANRFAGLRAESADVLQWRGDKLFDHAFANPPWHEAAGTGSPVAARQAAKQSRPWLLAQWTASMARAVRLRGTVSLVVPACAVAEAIGALQAAKCRGVTLLPLWPRRGVAAKIVILRAVRLGRGKDTISPGLILHDAGGFTAEAEAILRAGGRLP